MLCCSGFSFLLVFSRFPVSVSFRYNGNFKNSSQFHAPWEIVEFLIFGFCESFSSGLLVRKILLCSITKSHLKGKRATASKNDITEWT